MKRHGPFHGRRRTIVERRIDKAVANFEHTGILPEWLAARALKDDALMRRLFPALFPERFSFKSMDGILLAYFAPTIAKLFNSTSLYASKK